MPNRKQFGYEGEQLAKKYLINKGYNFLTQNFRTRFGEIDLVFENNGQLVFVEVKTRSNLNKGRPEESVTQRKIKQIYRVAEAFFQKYPKLPQSGRIEVVAVIENEITHIKEV